MSEPTDRDSAALRALAAEVEQIGRRLTGVETVAADAADETASAQRAIAQVVELVERLATRGASAAEPADDASEKLPPWLVVDDDETAQTDIGDLVGWLGAVFLHYDGAELTDCWMWHPGVIAELTALRDLWNAAHYGEKASPAAVMDWHDRYRPGTVQRVGKELADCHLERHGANGDRAYQPPRVPGVDMTAELVRWWVASHGGTAAPAPTPAMLAAARAQFSARPEW